MDLFTVLFICFCFCILLAGAALLLLVHDLRFHTNKWYTFDISKWIYDFLFAKRKKVKKLKWYSSLSIYYRNGRVFNWILEIEEDDYQRKSWIDFYRWYNTDKDDDTFTIETNSADTIISRNEIVAIECIKILK